VSRFAEGSVTGAYRIGFAGAGSASVVLKIYQDQSPWSAAKEARALRFLTGHGFDMSPRVLVLSRATGALNELRRAVKALPGPHAGRARH
jgi:hypothetical protein